jgi:hypothetical protein
MNPLKKTFLFWLLCYFGCTYILVAQNQPEWGLRIGFSSTEDKLGFGIAYYPMESKWLHHLEVYPIQNRGSEITIQPKNWGFLVRNNYKLNGDAHKINITVGSEVYYSKYSRIIVGTPNNVPDVSQSLHLMAITGLNFRLGKRVNADISLPIVGFISENSNGVSNNFPAIVGLLGFFLPKAGIQVGIF